jgi:hypothetical protein
MNDEIEKMIAAISENNIPWTNSEGGSEPFTSTELEEMEQVALNNDLTSV